MATFEPALGQVLGHIHSPATKQYINYFWNSGTTSSVQNVIEISGWDYIAGASANSVNKTITFPVTFTTIYEVSVTFIGSRDGSNPSVITDLGADDRPVVHCNASTTQLTVYISHKDAATNLISTFRYGYSFRVRGII